MSAPKTPQFARNERQEEILREVNRLLGSAEREARPELRSEPQLPIVFIVGAPRSGTTLMLQWLAASGWFAYPSNLIARFYGAPYIGARIQQLLADPDLDYRNEVAGLTAGVAWSSDIGKTRGLLQPHEFSYFWRRFFPIDQAQKLTDDQLAQSDPQGFAAGWAGLEEALGKPVAAKGILLQYDIARLAEWLPTSIFVFTRRDPLYNIESLLRARERVLGTREAWFSVRPPEYEWLQHEDPYVQVAGQVHFTNCAIEAALSALPAHRAVRVSYEHFCSDPASLWMALSKNLSLVGGAPLGPYNGPSNFKVTNDIADPDLVARIVEAHSGIDHGWPGR